jgi:hypothetical protein
MMNVRLSDREIDGSQGSRCWWAEVRMGRGEGGLKCLRAELNSPCGLVDDDKHQYFVVR